MICRWCGSSLRMFFETRAEYRADGPSSSRGASDCVFTSACDCARDEVASVRGIGVDERAEGLNLEKVRSVGIRKAGAYLLLLLLLL